MQKLYDIGAPEVFLLEAFIVEAGFSDRFGGTMPDVVRESVIKKRQQIDDADYGYVVMSLEQMSGFSENRTGILWPLTLLQRAKSQPPGQAFKSIINKIEEYAERIDVAKEKSIITYCEKCKSLTWTHPRGPYVCANCSNELL